MTQAILCAGIDPNPISESFSEFQAAVRLHKQFVETEKPTVIKPNLSFFLKFGSKGIAELEELCWQLKDVTRVVVDAKLNEISNSLSASLDFVFKTLGAHGVTVNPFLGQKTITMALDKALKHDGVNARIYVLCATSEGGTGDLRFFQEGAKNTLRACNEIQIEFFGKDYASQPHLGVVIGANRTEILFSPEFMESGLSGLCPGLGAQGASFEVVSNFKMRLSKNELTFPLSRGIFEGGNTNLQEARQRFQKIKKDFFEV